MNKKLFAIILVMSFCKCFGQTGIVMPPTPTVAAIAKYIDRPISYYTGIPEVKVPLWTINMKNYSLPIELNYHGGGVKIEEEASNVGLSKGMTQSYEYDNFQRLKNVKDQNGNIIKSYIYHYKN